MSMTSVLIVDPYVSPTRDREVIQIDFSSEKLGIARSLRQAFAAASQDDCSRDFQKLIDDLD